MKRIYLLVILLAASVSGAFAQRTSDIQVTLTSPTTSTVLNPGGSFAVDAVIKNLGPDSIRQSSDSILWYMSIQNGLVNLTIGSQSGTTWLRYNKSLKVGDTFHISFPTLTPSGYSGQADSNRTFCFYAFPRGPQGDTIADPNATPISSSNNRACATFLWKKTVGIDDVQGYGQNNVRLFPNPAHDVANIAFDMQTPGAVTFKVFDVAGREVVKLNKGNMSSGKHYLSADISNLPNGVYVYQLYVGSDVTTGRLTVD